MAYRYITYPIKDLGAGIDQQSAENQIQEGYCETILNADPEPMGYIAKRLGYQRHCGQLPVRVTKVEYSDDSTNNLCFFLDSAIDISSINLLNTRRVPLVVQGKTSSENTANVGDFPNDSNSVKYYATFDADVEKNFSTGTNTLEDDGVGSDDIFVHTSRRLNSVDRDNEVFIPSDVTIDTTDSSIDIDYTNNTGSAFEGYVYISRKSASTGTTYISSKTTPISIATGTSTTTITTATHGLSNFNIDTRIYRVSGTDYIEITADEVKIAANGDVSFEITNNTGSAFDAIFYITAYPAANTKFGTIVNGTTDTITITGLTQDFIGAVVYLEETVGGTKREVIPDSISVDSSTNTATITFTNNTGSNTNFFVYWEEIEITSNKLCVTGSTISTANQFTDTNPQLTIWGLDHEAIYGTASNAARPGWVTHLDSYKSEGDNRLIAGLGGNIFTETSDSTNYLLPTLYPNINGRASTDVNVGPTFFETSETPSRTRGYIKSDNVVSNKIDVTSIEYVSGNSVKYTITDSTLTYSASPVSLISTTSNIEDYLTITNAAHPKHNGTFKITAVALPTATSIEITVENTNVNCADFDESNTSATAGIFTDQITQTATSEFLTDDVLSSDLFEFSKNYKVTGTATTTTVVDNITTEFLIPGGLLLVARRTGRVLPLRDINGTGSVTNLVVNDSLTRTELNRKLTVKYINSRANESISITGDGTTATLTLSTSETTSYAVGQTFLLRQAGAYTGEQIITALTGTSTFQFASKSTASESGTLVGYTATLDESLTLEDSIDNSIVYSVNCRWAPVEVPTDSFTQTKATYVQHLDAKSYSQQDYLRSVMVSNNMYLTNGSDEVFKYDGTNIYRAGLFRWQPHLFITTTTSPASGGKVNYTPTEAAISAFTANKATVGRGEESQFSIGQKVRDNNSNDYVITDLYDDGTNGIIRVDGTIQGGATSFKELGLLRYYFRLNAVDANGNIVASAVTGSEDTTIEIEESSQIKIRLIGLPAWHIYDYDRLEVEVYRTDVNSEAPYYKLITIPMSFNAADGYIDFIDDKSDEVLRDFDVVNSAFFGGTSIGTQFSEPMRAKYITSAGNRLVLANLTDYPELDIKYEHSEALTISDLDGGRYFFRKDNTDVGTSSNLTDRQGYEFVDTATSAITPATDITNNSGTSFTIADAGHSVTAGQWVYLYHTSLTGENSLEYAGWWKVESVVASTSFTINHVHESGYTPSAIDIDSYVVATQAADVPVFLGTDGNYEQSGYNPSSSEDYTENALIRLANAINVSMRNTNSPWMIAGAGGDFGVDQLVIRQPRVESSKILEVELPTFSGYNIFVQQVKRTTGEQVSASTRLYPSRLIVSGNNYPEIFDNPREIIDSLSNSAIDVNSADGEQITGVIPFFGESAFGAAQKDGILVVFKEASIYLVNIAQKEAGQNPIQKLESQGLGCTAPYSIAVTRDGVIFANRSGIFKLTRDLRIEYVGQKVERLWETDVNLDQLDEAVGHHYAVGRQYKLSYPTTSATENSKVFVYNHTREYSGQSRQGSWTQYTNHSATGWANLLSDAYFSTTGGAVMLIRNTGDVSDFRDDDAAISMEVIFRATDFGDAGIRKAISHLTAHFRNKGTMNGTKLFSAMDLETALTELDSFKILNETEKVFSVQFSIDRRKGIYFQIKMTNSAIDEPVELTSMDIRVSGLSDKGTTQAAST